MYCNDGEYHKIIYENLLEEQDDLEIKSIIEWRNILLSLGLNMNIICNVFKIHKHNVFIN